MSKVVVIHQPDFIPYLGFFQRLSQCDLFIVLDHVQFSKGGWHNRDMIKAPEGTKWLTIPVQLKGKHFPPINEVLVASISDWKASHLDQLGRCYGKAPFFDETFPDVEKIYALESSRLLDYSMRSIRWLMDKFSVNVPLTFSSELSPTGSSNEMLVDLLQKVGATSYLSGTGARNYFSLEPFQRAGIEVLWQDFTHPVYPQLHGEFVPYLSSIDILFNCGEKKSREILKSCGKQKD